MKNIDITAIIEKNAATGNLTNLAKNRCENTARGSYLLGVNDPQVVENFVKGAAWAPYNHPAIDTAEAVGFRAELPPELKGVFGIVEIESLQDDAAIWLSDAHHGDLGDGRPMVAACTEQVGNNHLVSHMTLLVGVNGDWMTFFPGDPVRPSEIPAIDLEGKRINKAQAIAARFAYAKTVNLSGGFTACVLNHESVEVLRSLYPTPSDGEVVRRARYMTSRLGRAVHKNGTPVLPLGVDVFLSIDGFASDGRCAAVRVGNIVCVENPKLGETIQELMGGNWTPHITLWTIGTGPDGNPTRPMAARELVNWQNIDTILLKARVAELPKGG